MPSYTAKEIRELRNRLGENQTVFGQRLGVGREWVSQLENGTGEVSELVAIKLREIEALYEIRDEFPAQVQEQHQEQGLARQRLHLSPAAAREPTQAELVRQFMDLSTAAEAIPGGLYYLQRALRRFQKEHIDPIE